MRRESIATAANRPPSPFADPLARPLDPAKFRDPELTARGDRRARVAFDGLRTLWLNTGTLCNLACSTCYIASSPVNDALVYLTLNEAEPFLDEAAVLGAHEIGFTGGEPFMNPAIAQMIAASLTRGFDVLVLTNAMRPMRRFEAELLALPRDRLTLRVSLDHHRGSVHEAERGAGTWEKTLAGIDWLSRSGFRIAVAGRQLPGESQSDARAGYLALFKRLGIEVAGGLVLFPAMDSAVDVPEISEACWGMIGVSPSAPMCASSRMVVKARGAGRPHVVACTLLPYDPRFALGPTLADARREVPLNHPHCARFCVLGGASCSG